MFQGLSIAPQNSMILIDDPGNRVGPDWEEGAQITVGETAILVAVLPEADGPTQIILTDETNWPGREGLSVIANATLPTPSLRLVVSTVVLDTLLEIPCSTEVSSVSVYAPSGRWWDTVVVFVQPSISG